MRFKKLGRVICACLLSGVAISVPVLTGCNTDHPEAKITVEYEGITYVLNYKMYRNMYPQTVQHFIELADNGFYTDMIVHNYQTSYWYTGGYGYKEEGEGEDKISYAQSYADGEDEMRDYLDAVCKDKQYADLANPELGKITPSVYLDFIEGKYVSPLTTLIGEFNNNQHKIENGALKGSYGALRMYYSSKSDVKDRVYLDKTGSQAGVRGEYKYNSATSQFSIQVSTSTSTDSNYCIFATIKDEQPLKDLRTAVTKSSSPKDVKLYIDNNDYFLGANNNETTYRLTKNPIIVKSVEIVKY